MSLCIEPTRVAYPRVAQAFEVKNVVAFCHGNELLAGLPYLRDQLDACQRQLSAYLEQKRNAFPRFYFVSDGVLLEILSQASDPQAIQPHMESIFDGVAQVVFEKAKATEKLPACLRIQAMISQVPPPPRPVQATQGVGSVNFRTTVLGGGLLNCLCATCAV